MDVNLIPWWGWIAVGAVAWFLVQSFILPDKWSVWLAERKNGPGVLIIFGIIAFCITGGSFIAAIWEPIQKIFGNVTIEWWIKFLFYFGIFATTVYLISKIKLPKINFRKGEKQQ